MSDEWQTQAAVEQAADRAYRRLWHLLHDIRPIGTVVPYQEKDGTIRPYRVIAYRSHAYVICVGPGQRIGRNDGSQSELLERVEAERE